MSGMLVLRKTSSLSLPTWTLGSTRLPTWGCSLGLCFQTMLETTSASQRLPFLMGSIEHLLDTRGQWKLILNPTWLPLRVYMLRTWGAGEPKPWDCCCNKGRVQDQIAGGTLCCITNISCWAPHLTGSLGAYRVFCSIMTPNWLSCEIWIHTLKSKMFFDIELLAIVSRSTSLKLAYWFLPATTVWSNWSAIK